MALKPEQIPNHSWSEDEYGNVTFNVFDTNVHTVKAHYYLSKPAVLSFIDTYLGHHEDVRKSILKGELGILPPLSEPERSER